MSRWRRASVCSRWCGSGSVEVTAVCRRVAGKGNGSRFGSRIAHRHGERLTGRGPSLFIQHRPGNRDLLHGRSTRAFATSPYVTDPWARAHRRPLWARRRPSHRNECTPGDSMAEAPRSRASGLMRRLRAGRELLYPTFGHRTCTGNAGSRFEAKGFDHAETCLCGSCFSWLRSCTRPSLFSGRLGRS